MNLASNYRQTRVRRLLAKAVARTGWPNIAVPQSYQDFFGLGQDAGPNIPILVQAKAEYTRLTLDLAASQW
jgi:hypothetical protein